MKVLVVEDDPNLSTLWAAVLEQQDHEATMVETQAGALSALRATGFDIVLLDLCLGGEDGLQVAEHATLNNPACKVIVITGSSLHDAEAVFDRDPSVWAMLRKPVDIEDLMALCDHLGAGGSAPPPAADFAGIAEFRV